MRIATIGVLLAAAMSLNALAQQPAVKETLTVESNVVALADGGTIVIGKDGRTYHQDAAGKRARMKDGVVMDGKDGRKYLHKNDAIWQQIATKGTLAPNR